MGIIITFLVYLIVVAVVWWLGNYILDNLPLPGPLAQIGRVVLTVVLVLIGLMLLLQLVGIGGSLGTFPTIGR